MMYSIRRKQRRFLKLSESCINDVNIRVLSNTSNGFFEREKFIYSAGILNKIWQNWGSFWRTYWLVQLLGGIDKDNNKIPKNTSAVSKIENRAIFQLNSILRNRNNPVGIINGSYQEPTWGDRNDIEKLSLEFFSSPSANSVSSAMSIYGNTVSHMQLVRNASIHLDRDNINRVITEVLPFYSLTSIKYPTDILFANDLSTGKIVIKSWIDDLNALLLFI